MRITSSGEVGIGTTSPADKLEVQDGNIRIQTISNTDAKLILNPYSGTIGTGYQWELVGKNAAANYNFQIRENGTPYLTIENSVNGNTGNVGIGTTSPSYKLDVAASGGIRAGGKTTYTKTFSSGLNTSGELVAEITTGYNGASALFEFTCFGGNAGCYQKVIWSLYNASGTWYASNPINEGTNHFDVAYSSGEFTFKTRSGTQAYQPRVIVEAAGDSIDNSYA